MVVFKEISKQRGSEFEKAVSELILGAFFFAMRSCEYVKTYKPGRTKKLHIRNIKFTKIRRTICKTSKEIFKADYVSITYEFQKNADKFEVILQERSGKALCQTT